MSAEARLIERFVSAARSTRDGGTVLGPGDDAAVLHAAPKQMVITTDTALEHSHFERAWLSPEDLAWRVLGGALSDVAAMGAIPRWYTLAATLTDAVDEAWIDRFAKQLGACALRWQIDLVGGDLTRGQALSFTPTCCGTISRGRALRRDGGAAGHGLWVSGALGGAAAGLAHLITGGRNKGLTAAFRRPEPRLLLGASLVRTGIASACCDLSDGLLVDAASLCHKGAPGIDIDTDKLPRHRSVTALAEGPDQATDWLLRGGEDYELLFTVTRPQEEALGDLADAIGVPLTRIGTLSATSGLRDQRGNSLTVEGWDPFDRSAALGRRR
jgi:thiamine-monophosphate kinase